MSSFPAECLYDLFQSPSLPTSVVFHFPPEWTPFISEHLNIFLFKMFCFFACTFQSFSPQSDVFQGCFHPCMKDDAILDFI